MGFNQTGFKADGFQVVNLGVHSGVAPNTLANNQLSWAINVTTRNGFPETRKGWKKKALKFIDETGALNTTLRDNFRDGLFQGAIGFEYFNQLVASIGGRLFTISLDADRVDDVSISGDTNRADLRRAWMVEAAGFVVVQDGQDSPIIYDGQKSRRSDQTGANGEMEIPTGTVMNYSQGRIWVTSPDGISFIAGNIVYGPSGTSKYDFRDSILRFTENKFLNGGGAFGIPLNAGRIRAMHPIAQLDTSTGQGPLQVFTDRAIFSVNAPVDRTAWQNLEYPIQSVSLIDSGATSWTSPISVNGDIWFRSHDGIRSFKVARRDFSGWANTDQSRELTRVISRDDKTALGYASSGLLNNRLFMTVAPHRSWDHGTYFKGIGVLDFAPISSLRGQSQPVWDGVWTGLNILQLISGVFGGISRMFAFVLNSSDEIELWEMTNEPFDDAGSGRLRITSSIETAAFNYKSGFDQLRMEKAELHYDQIQDQVDFDLAWRPDQEPCWSDWHTWTSSANIESCLTEDPVTGCSTNDPDTLQPQYRHRVQIPAPPNTCESITGKPYRNGYEFQVRLEWTGAVRIKKCRLFASDVAETAFTKCLETV